MAALPPNYRKAETMNLGVYTFIRTSCDDCRFQREHKGREACLKYSVVIRRDTICDSFSDRRDGVHGFESPDPTPEELALSFKEPLVEINPAVQFTRK